MGYQTQNTWTCRLRTQVPSRSQAQAKFFFLFFFFFKFKLWVFHIVVSVSWRPHCLFLGIEPFTRKGRHCDLSIFMGTKPLWDPLSQSVMSRKDSKGNAGGSKDARMGVAGEISEGCCYAPGILHLSVLVRSAVNVRSRFAQVCRSSALFLQAAYFHGCIRRITCLLY